MADVPAAELPVTPSRGEAVSAGPRRPEPRHGDVPSDVADPDHAALSRDRRPLPPAMFASVGHEPGPPKFPWLALVAVAAAAFAVGGLVFYQLGLRQAATVVAPPAAPASQTDTDVKVPTGTAPTQPGTPPATPPPPIVDSPGQADATASTSPANTGRLAVHSLPSGAALRVNGRAHGTTPQTLRDLPMGRYRIEVSRRGYVSKTQEIVLSARAPSRDVTLTLAAAAPATRTAPAAAKTGSLYVDTRPRGARVVVDGKSSGRTPLTVPGLADGDHAVRVELAGYKTVTTTVTIKAGATERMTLTLERGELAVAGLPPRRD